VKSATPAIIAALKDPAPPSRMAAANALADLEANDAIPALKAALNDPDPAVRQMIGVALARLGDESGGVTMQSLAASPVGDLRLIAARTAARENPQGPWAGTVEGLLTDPDPLLRLKAARLLLESGRPSPAASAALTAALADQSPALRTEAARLLRETGRQQPAAGDPGSLRRLLRDRLPDVQIEAARGLLGLVR
jgi:HEAT repeat protein